MPPGSDEIDLTVGLLPGGEMSEFLHEVVEPGDELEVRGPIGGWFVWPGDTPALGVASCRASSRSTPARWAGASRASRSPSCCPDHSTDALNPLIVDVDATLVTAPRGRVPGWWRTITGAVAAVAIPRQALAHSGPSLIDVVQDRMEGLPPGLVPPAAE